MRKQIIKTLALVLVFALILSAAAPPKAAAVIPEGLLIAAAIALTMGTCVAITMIAADSAGMTGAIQVAAEKGLQDTAEFTEKLIRGFNEERGMLFTNFILMMAKGARITRDGALALGEEVSAWLTDFFDWAWSEEGGNLQASAPYVGDSYYSFDLSSYSDPGITDWESLNSGNISYTTKSGNIYNISGGVGICARKVGSSEYFMFVFSKDQTNFTLQGVNNGYNHSVSGVRTSYLGETFYYYSFGNQTNAASVNLPFSYYISSGSPIVAGYVVLFGSGVLEGEREQADTNVLQLPAEGAIDTNILNIPDQLVLPPVQGTATADSYLGAVRDAIYEGTGTLDYTDANDIAGTATLEMTGTATVDQVASGAGQLEGSTEVAEGVGSPTLDNYSIDLRDFFPFCIPFDIYDMLNLMSGSRAAPQVHWEFYVPGPNGMETYNLDLDFSVLDPVASVLRTMELLAFGVALALATKKLLMGS